MALLTNLEQGYTKTGGGFFMKVSNGASYVPFIGAPIALLAGKIGTLLDAGGWLLRGKVSSAGTALAAGAVATATNTMTSGSGVGSLANWGSFVTTGRSVSGHTRKVTELVTGGVAGVVGIKPQVLQQYPSAPGQFASKISAERGVNAQDQYNNYMRGEGGVHVNELNSANLGR